MLVRLPDHIAPPLHGLEGDRHRGRGPPQPFGQLPLGELLALAVRVVEGEQDDGSAQVLHPKGLLLGVHLPLEGVVQAVKQNAGAVLVVHAVPPPIVCI